MKLPCKTALIALILIIQQPAFATWRDISDSAGLGNIQASVIKFSDINGDGWPDIVAIPRKTPAPPQIFLHWGIPSETPSFELFTESNLPVLQSGDVLVFADIDNDGNSDALLSRYLDLYQDKYVPPAEPPATAWFPGRGNGQFGAPRVIETATMGTTRAIAVGDINLDGQPDLFFGNWYVRYFSGYEAFSNDLLLQYSDHDGPSFVRWPIPGETAPTTHLLDGRGRPTYGALACLLDTRGPMILELNYGRRWNRLYTFSQPEPLFRRDSNPPAEPFILKEPAARGQDLIRSLVGRDIAPETGIDGDAIRHGRHPTWPKDMAAGHPRSNRPDEPPFRANGNTFDAAIGDIDNDGDFDLFLTTIIHAWAGESSDRSRFLVNQLEETGELHFLSFERLSVDRLPPLPEPGQSLRKEHVSSNQGDIHAELADLDNDGRLDLILCSSDYADAPPYEERLRLYYQQADGRFKDCTQEMGIDHIGAGMPSLADVDGDGDLDLVVGQSFNRLPPDQRRKAAMISGALGPDSPDNAPAQIRARLFLNNPPSENKAIVIHLQGDPALGCTREAFHSLVTVVADTDGQPDSPAVRQIRQVLGPGGHAGGESPPWVHFGIGKANTANVTVQWAGQTSTKPQTFEAVSPGTYRLQQGGPLVPIARPSNP